MFARPCKQGISKQRSRVVTVRIFVIGRFTTSHHVMLTK